MKKSPLIRALIDTVLVTRRHLAAGMPTWSYFRSWRGLLCVLDHATLNSNHTQAARQRLTDFRVSQIASLGYTHRNTGAQTEPPLRPEHAKPRGGASRPNFLLECGRRCAPARKAPALCRSEFAPPNHGTNSSRCVLPCRRCHAISGPAGRCAGWRLRRRRVSLANSPRTRQMVDGRQCQFCTRTPEGFEPLAEAGSECAVIDRTSNLQQQVGASSRPAHPAATCSSAD